MPDILLNIFIGLVVASIGAIATKSYQVAKHHRRNAHLYSLLAPKGRVQIVVPAFTVTDFVPLGTSDPATVPSNLRAMPMAEGGAIAQMVTMLHSLGCGEYRLVPTEAFQDNAHLTISFGGPSVNPVSDNILRKYFPSFGIKYPEHIASYGTTTFVSAKAPDGTLTEDYGFIAVVTAESERKYVVLCGVWSMGTQIATEALLHLPRQSEVRDDLRRRRNLLAITHGTVTGLSYGHVQIVGVHHV